MESSHLQNTHRLAFILREADETTGSDDLTLARQILARAGTLPEAAVSPGLGVAEVVIAEALTEALLSDPDAIPDELRAQIAEPESAPTEDPSMEGDLDFFIRSVPFRTSTNPLSAPGLAAGRRVERTLGPFIGPAGRLIWIDLFRRVRQVAVVRGGGTSPFLLLPLRGFITAATVYRLSAGSIWIRSRLITPAAPDGGYCGIRIKGGTLVLSSSPAVVGGTLQISGGVTVTLEIETDSPAPASSGGTLGPDARAARAHPPGRARFVFSGITAALAQASEAKMRAYGSSATLTHVPAVARFEPLLNRVLLPFAAEPDAFRIRNVRSDLFEPVGEAETMGGAWALAVTIAAPNTLGDAANAGAVAIRIRAGLRAEWRGLAAGPVRLGETIIMVEPDRLVLATTRGPGLQARHTIRLWQEAGTPAAVASQLTLGLRSPEPLRFFSEAGVLDALQVDSSIEASLDRPIGVDGNRFPLRADKASIALWNDATGFRLLAVADMSPRTSAAQQALRAMALTNALIRLGSPVLLLITGRLTAPDQIDAGLAILLFGVNAIVPALRDPYVTNFALPLRDVADRPESTVARLLALITWPIPDRPEMLLNLLPNANAAGFSALVPPQRDTTPAASPLVSRVAVSHGLDDKAAQAALNGLFRETAGSVDARLLLVDVSSNIDQFGIGWGLTGRSAHVNPQTDLPLRINGLDLSAPTRNLRVILLPQFQWEPVTNLPNPLVTEVFPNRLASADDGGPTALGTSSVTLVPIAPERLTAQILAEYNAGPNGRPIGAYFTLPFGMKAAARFQPDTGFEARWATVGLNRPATPDGRFTGGLQIAAEAHPDQGTAVESPSFPGAAWQLRNGIDTATHTPLGLSVLSAGIGNPGVEQFFNNEMGPGSKLARVPVKRIDFSGYGASTFSRWTNPNAVAAVSHVRFDVFVGRTAYEVVQIASVLYCTAAPVVRTITLERRKEGAVVRFDSGWVATAPGVFRYPAPDPGVPLPAGWTAIETHPGIVRGAFNIRRIRETGRVVSRTFPPEAGRPAILVELLEVRFDADFEIEGLVSPRSAEGRVTSVDQVGFVQRSPIGYPLLPEHLAAILDIEGPVGGPIDCLIDIASSGQHLQAARVDVATSPMPFGGPPQFAAAARGALALPRDGEWSTIRHDLTTAAAQPQPVDAHAGVPVVRVGTASGSVSASPWHRIAEPADLLREDTPRVQFGLVQGSEGHRALFPRPRIHSGETRWSSTERPALADTYTLSLGVGAFPALDACFVGQVAWGLSIGGDGRYTLLPAPTMNFTAPPAVADRRLIDSAAFKIRTRYQSAFRFRLDPSNAVPWAVETDPDAIFTTMDLGPFSELLGIRHGFRVAADAAPAFSAPQTVYPPPLQPVIEILEFLAELLGIDNPLEVSGFQGSFKFKATLNLPIENPRVADRYFDFGAIKVKGKLKLGVSSAPTWNGFLNLELGAKVPVFPPIFGGGEIGVDLEGGSLSQQKVTITVKWSASVGTSLGPISVQGSFFFGIQVIVSTTGSWQIGLLVGISASADIWIAKITVKLELLAAISVLTAAEDPPSGSKQALGRAKFAAEVSVAWFLTVSVEYTLEYKERLRI